MLCTVEKEDFFTQFLPLAPYALTCGSRPSIIKIWGPPVWCPILWHILHILIQCNAKSPSVAFVKSPEYSDNGISNIEK